MVHFDQVEVHKHRKKKTDNDRQRNNKRHPANLTNEHSSMVISHPARNKSPITQFPHHGHSDWYGIRQHPQKQSSCRMGTWTEIL